MLGQNKSFWSALTPALEAIGVSIMITVIPKSLLVAMVS